MTGPMTLREQVARAIYDANPEMFIPASDATIPVPYDDIPDEWRANQLAAADAAISLITEACAQVAETTYAHDAFHFELGTAVAQRIRQLVERQ